MKGDIVQQHGSYLEIVLEESGSTRLILCFNFKPEEQQPIKNRCYRIEYWYQGQLQHKTPKDITEGLALFHELIGGKPEDTSIQKRQFSRQLSERIDQGLCIHCGTTGQVIRALCAECRKLPRFQQVLGS